MIVWGGFPTGSGGRYDPATDTWAPVSTLSAPPGGTALWTGSRMLIWAGPAGGLYDPVSDTWSPIASGRR